jgi:hypothetical protein
MYKFIEINNNNFSSKRNNMFNIDLTKLWVVLIFSIIGIIFGPIAVIWAFNDLFKLNIEYNFSNWLAVAILVSVIKRNTQVVNNK